MGPRSSEPEQRDYAITITAPDGTTTSAGIVRSHHALDAAREAAEARNFGTVLKEWCAASGAWHVSTASGHVVMGLVDTPSHRAVHAQMRPEKPRWAATEQTNDKRALVQRRLADAIRYVQDAPCKAAIAAILEPGWLEICRRDASCASVDERAAIYAARQFAMALAAAARCPAILDAVRQVAQVHALEVREEHPSEGG